MREHLPRSCAASYSSASRRALLFVPVQRIPLFRSKAGGLVAVEVHRFAFTEKDPNAAVGEIDNRCP